MRYVGVAGEIHATINTDYRYGSGAIKVTLSTEGGDTKHPDFWGWIDEIIQNNYGFAFHRGSIPDNPVWYNTGYGADTYRISVHMRTVDDGTVEATVTAPDGVVLEPSSILAWMTDQVNDHLYDTFRATGDYNFPTEHSLRATFVLASS